MAPAPTAAIVSGSKLGGSQRFTATDGPCSGRDDVGRKSDGGFMRQRASKAIIVVATFAVLLSEAKGQQMSQEQMQQMMQQQQMGGGGSPPPPTPNRVAQLFTAAGASSAALARTARKHPRTAAATAAAATTAVYVGAETRRSGVLLCREPRISLFKPSDSYLSRVLEKAADAPVSAPLRGVILSPLENPKGGEELEDDRDDSGCENREAGSTNRRRAVGSGKAKLSRSRRSSSRSRHIAVDDDDTESCTSTGIKEVLTKAREKEAGGVYTEVAFHSDEGKRESGGKGKIKSVCAGVRVGRGLGLYHKFAQGLENLDVFDGRSDCELVAAESSSEGLGSTLGLLTRPAMGTWSLSPLRVALLRETTAAVPRTNRRTDGTSHTARNRSRHRHSGKRKRTSEGTGNGRRKRRAKGRSTRKHHKKKVEKEDGGGHNDDNDDEEPLRHRQFSMALSAVEGAGWSGTWVFRVTYDAGSDEVWFQTSLAQRTGKFGLTVGGDLTSRVKRVNEDMVERGDKHAKVLKTREEQLSRISSLSRTRAQNAKELERDRILHPDKYKRVHRWMREDSHTTGGASARPARWGEERRRNDIRLK